MSDDPRLDVVARLVRESWRPGAGAVDYARRILDALDAMRPDERERANDPGDMRCPTCDHDPTVMQPAPSGLTPAQEIRLRVLESYGPSDAGDRNTDAAWVEHGDDETPALRQWAEGEITEAGHHHQCACNRNWGGPCGPCTCEMTPEQMKAEADDIAARQKAEAASADYAPDDGEGDVLAGLDAIEAVIRERDAAQARADLAEARLGQVAKLLDGGVYTGPLWFALREALAWTPDDTATAGAATGDGWVGVADVDAFIAKERLRPGDPGYLSNADITNGNPLTAGAQLGTLDTATGDGDD